MRIVTDNLETLMTRRGLHCIWEPARDGKATRLAARWIDESLDAPNLSEQEEVATGDDSGPLPIIPSAWIQTHISVLDAAWLLRQIRSSVVIFLCSAHRKDSESCNTPVKSQADTESFFAYNLFSERHVETGAWCSMNCAAEMQAGREVIR